MQRKNITMIVAVVVLAVAAGLYFSANVPTTPAPIVVKPSTPVVTTSNKPATVKITSVIAPVSNSASAADAATAPRIIKWEGNNFPTGATVDVNLIQKISDSPVAYEMVRSIASNVSNSGQVIWTPMQDESLDDLYIEVVCSNSYQFKSACTVTGQPIKAI